MYIAVTTATVKIMETCRNGQVNGKEGRVEGRKKGRKEGKGEEGRNEVSVRPVAKEEKEQG